MAQVPTVGVTHDVVIYDGAANLVPVGLIVRPYSYRVGEAPTFIPRMAIGDPRGTDYATFTSYIQKDWRGKSQVERGSSHDYFQAVGLAPARLTGDLQPINSPTVVHFSGCASNYNNNPNPVAHTPVIQGVQTSLNLGSPGYGRSTTRVFYGRRVFMPKMGITMPGTIECMHWVMDLQDNRYAYDAVQFSGIAFISTYKINTVADVGYISWHPLLAHVGNSMWQPAHATTAGALAVYDNRIWRAEPEGWRIAYFEPEKFRLSGTQQGTLTYVGEGDAAEFRDTGQDFSEWETTSGRARYALIVTNGDQTLCWGFMGASNNGGQDIDIYSDDTRSTRGWARWAPQLPVTDGKTPIAYEVQYNTALGFTAEGWSDYITLDPIASIRAMEPFLGRLFIGCLDALWAYEAGRAYKVVDFTERASLENFAVMKTLHGSLWFNIGNTMYRYTSGGLLEEMAADFGYRFPRSITAGRGCVFIVATRWPGLVNCRVYRLDSETGAVQEVMDADRLQPYGVPMDQGAVGVFTCMPEPLSEAKISSRLRPKVVVGPVLTTLHYTGDGLVYLDFGFADEMISGEDMPSVTAGNNPLLHCVTSIWMDMGYPAVVKCWERLRLRCEIPVWEQAVTVYYRTIRGATWTVLGSLDRSDVAISGTAELLFPANTTSTILQLKVGISLVVGGQTRPAISAIEVDATLGLIGKRRVQFNAIVTDGLELLDLTIENSAAFVAASLYSLASLRTIHTVALPFPPPVGHTTRARVELGPIGAVVPILSYTGIPSNSPGADVSVVITEV